MSWDILPKGNLQYFLQKLKAKFDLKVDKEAGKGLSTNDYTTTEKNKLAGIETGAQVNPTIDSALSDSSTNAVQNKIVKAALDGKAGREEIPTKVSQLTNDSGYTTNTGTVTQVKVGSAAYNPSSGVVSLPAYPAAVAVKGNAESTYRTGNVNITPANIGLGNVNNTADASKNVNSANKVNYTKSTSEGTFTYPCEVEGELSNSEDKIPNSAAVVDYLNSNFVNSVDIIGSDVVTSVPTGINNFTSLRKTASTLTGKYLIVGYITFRSTDAAEFKGGVSSSGGNTTCFDVKVASGAWVSMPVCLLIDNVNHKLGLWAAHNVSSTITVVSYANYIKLN